MGEKNKTFFFLPFFPSAAVRENLQLFLESNNFERELSIFIGLSGFRF